MTFHRNCLHHVTVAMSLPSNYPTRSVNDPSCPFDTSPTNATQ